MTLERSLPRGALLRALILIIGLYALLIGGTFSGLTDASLQRGGLGLLSVITLAWLIGMWRSPRRTQPGAPFGQLFFVWSAVFALSFAASPSGRSLIALWYMALYAGLWLILSDLRQRDAIGAAFSELIMVAALPLIFWAFVQVLPWFLDWWAVRDLGVPFYPVRPVGTLGNPNLLGAYLALALPFGLARTLSVPDRLGRALMMIWIGLTAGTLYLTYSRGAWLAAAGGVGVFALLMAGPSLVRKLDSGFSGWWRPREVIAALVLGTVVLGIGGVFAWRVFESPQRETGARLGYYTLALDRLIERPLTGTGLFTFGRELAVAQSIPPEQPHAHTHNLVLNVSAELGIPGLAALGFTGLLVARSLWRSLQAASTRSGRLHAAGAAASLAAIALHSLVDLPLMVPALVLAALSALAAGIEPPPQPRRVLGHRNLFARVGVTALWIVVLLTGWKGQQNYERYSRGQNEMAEGDVVGALADLRAAADAQPMNTLYRAEYAYTAGLAAGQGDRAAAVEAVEAYQRALDVEPAHALWWANLAAVEWARGESLAAMIAIRQAVQVAPSAADLWLNLGQYAEDMGDAITAQRAYARALHLAPRMASATFWRQTPLRRVALARTSGAAFPETIAQRLWLAGEDDAAIALLHRDITQDPTQPRPYIEVARLALEQGEIERATAYLDAADVLKPLGADAAWVALLRADIAAGVGDEAQAQVYRARARLDAGLHVTGYRWAYGPDTAHYQFLSLTVPGKLLPQLTVLGPEPAALEAALRAQD